MINTITEIKLKEQLFVNSDIVYYHTIPLKMRRLLVTVEQLEKYIDLCCQKLDEMQGDLHTKYGLGAYEKYWCDLEKKILQFKNNDTVIDEFYVIYFASWSTKSTTWMWGWANEHFPEHVRKDSVRLKKLATTLGLDLFDTPVFECDDDMAYVLTAISCDHFDLMGTYRIPTKNGYVVLGITDRLTEPQM